MWCNGHKFHIKKLDETRKNYDSGITAIFQVTNFLLGAIDTLENLKIDTMDI
jgi:hypothetical protein